jgi:hypothetical protein
MGMREDLLTAARWLLVCRKCDLGKISHSGKRSYDWPSAEALPAPLVADSFEELVEIVLAEIFALFQAFVVEDEAFDDVFPEGFCGPDAKASGFDGVSQKDSSS